MHLVVQLCRDCEHHADTLELANGSENTAAVNGSDLQKFLHDESTLAGTILLNFEHPLGLTTLCPARTEAIGTSLKTPYFSRLAISLSDSSLQRAAWRRPMTSLTVFGIRSDSPTLGQLSYVFVMV